MYLEITDHIQDFGTVEGRVNVLFRQHEALYRLSPQEELFVEMVAQLARAWQSKQPVKVEVRGTNIITVKVL